MASAMLPVRPRRKCRRPMRERPAVGFDAMFPLLEQSQTTAVFDAAITAAECRTMGRRISALLSDQALVNGKLFLAFLLASGAAVG